MNQNKNTYQTFRIAILLFILSAFLLLWGCSVDPGPVHSQSPLPEWVTITEAQDCSAGCWVVDLERSEYWDIEESQGLHHAFAIALDPHGNQIAGLPFTVAYPTGSDTVLTKPAPDWADIALYADFDPNQGEAGPYWAYMGTGGGDNSEHVTGLGLPLNLHVSYRLVFVWQDGGGTATPTPDLRYKLGLPIISRN